MWQGAGGDQGGGCVSEGGMMVRAVGRRLLKDVGWWCGAGGEEWYGFSASGRQPAAVCSHYAIQQCYYEQASTMKCAASSCELAWDSPWAISVEAESQHGYRLIAFP
jgi:hypothetical protein